MCVIGMQGFAFLFIGCLACNFVMPLIARHFDLATPPVHIYNLQTSSIASYHTISFVYVSYLLIPCTLNSNTSSSLPILTNFTPLLTLVVLIYFIELSLFPFYLSSGRQALEQPLHYIVIAYGRFALVSDARFVFFTFYICLRFYLLFI